MNPPFGRTVTDVPSRMNLRLNVYTVTTALIVAGLAIASTITIRHLAIIPYHFFDAGPQLFLYNTARTVSAACLLLAILGTGRLFIHWVDRTASIDNPLSLLDICIIYLVSGTSILSILGAVLGLVGLLRLYIVLPLVAAMIAALILIRPPHWAAIDPVAVFREKIRGIDVLFIPVLLFLLLFLFFMKFIYPELYSGDSIGLYFPYIQTISESADTSRKFGGLDTFSFIYAKGSGLTLLFAVLTDGNATRFISWVQFAGCVFLLFRLCAYMLPTEGLLSPRGPFAYFIPLYFCILFVLLSPFTYSEFQRFHIQNAFWIAAFFTVLACRSFQKKERRAVSEKLLIVVGIAAAISNPHMVFFLAFILLFYGTLDVFNQEKNGWAFPLKAGGIILAALLVSLSCNYLLTGIIENYPTKWAVLYRNEDVFGRYCSSDVLNIFSIANNYIPTEKSIIFSPWLILPLPYVITIITLATVLAFRGRWKRGTAIREHRYGKLLSIAIPALALILSILIVIASARQASSLDRFLMFNHFFRFVLVAAAVIVTVDVLIFLGELILKKLGINVDWKKWIQRPFPLFVLWLVISIYILRICFGYFVDGILIHHRNASGRNAVTDQVDFFTGKLAYADCVQSSNRDFRFCRTLADQVPQGANILQVTAAGREHCVWGVSSFGKRFPYPYRGAEWGDILFGDPGRAAVQLKKSGFDFFYFDLSDERSNYSGIQLFSPLFRLRPLMEYFTLHWVSDDRYLLTWKSPGIRPVSPELASRIDRKARQLLESNDINALAYLRHKEIRESGARW